MPVVPRGAGTGLSGGATALDGGIVLSTERMRDIVVDPVTRTAVTQPGLFNAEVKKAVAEYAAERVYGRLEQILIAAAEGGRS